MPRIDLKLEEIPPEGLHRVECAGTSIVLVRSNGSVRAFLDSCPHAQWPLSHGELQDGILQCVGHGWQFDVHTGKCLTVPVCSLKLLPVATAQGHVRIEWEQAVDAHKNAGVKNGEENV
jgi:nitrite reductase/ring-hydroxylating ferredoxin subunit